MNHHLACGISTLALCYLAAPALAGDEPSRFIENETISTIVGDFEFTKGFPTPAPYQIVAALVDKMLEHGYSEADCGKFLGGNLYRVFQQVWF